MPIVLKSGSLDLLEPSGPVQACNGIALLYMFRALPCSSSGGLRRNCVHAASGIVSHLQTVTIPEAACIQLRRRPPEDEQGNARNM